jgi:hypothetical protein
MLYLCTISAVYSSCDRDNQRGTPPFLDDSRWPRAAAAGRAGVMSPPATVVVMAVALAATAAARRRRCRQRRMGMQMRSDTYRTHRSSSSKSPAKHCGLALSVPESLLSFKFGGRRINPKPTRYAKTV